MHTPSELPSDTAREQQLALFQVQDHHLLWIVGTAVALHYTESQGLETWS